MGIFGIGTDIVKVSRIKKLIINKKFLKRLFNKDEINKAKNLLEKKRVYRESIPDWIDELAIEEIGEKKWEKEISSMNNKADLVLRVNTLKTTKKNLIKKLYNQNIH